MISVIICSANAADLLQVKINISRTIGVPHEIIGFDNSNGQKGICEVYNEGARAARYDMLCFMHEDIEMKTEGWGGKVLEIFENNPQVGLIGVAGGGYKSLVPSGWYNADLEMNGEFYCCLIQGFKYSGVNEYVDYRNPKDEKLSRVASVDGCWLATRRSTALEHSFDENLLKGFHGYDIDFSLSVGQKQHVAVTYEILLRHFSEGAFSDDWEEQMLKVHKKWSAILPVNTDGLDEKVLLRYERRAFKAFFNKQLDKGSSYRRLISIIWNARHSRVFGALKWHKVFVDLWRVWKKRK
jgi:hypothetical protein